MKRNMAKKYVIARGVKLSGTNFFDTELEAAEYLQKNYMHPDQHRVIMFNDFI